jgi:hypothetical protein
MRRSARLAGALIIPASVVPEGRIVGRARRPLQLLELLFHLFQKREVEAHLLRHRVGIEPRNAWDHRVGLGVADLMLEPLSLCPGVDLFGCTSSLKMNASNSRNLFSRRVLACG